MKVSEATVNKMQELLRAFFDANAKSDNIAYWLGYNYYNNIEKLYHEKWAHAFPSDIFADGLSNFMLKLDVRPVRYGLEDHDYDYNDLIEAFEDNKKLAEDLVELVHGLIEVAEMNDDIEVKIYAESLSEVVLDYFKQAEEWEHVAKNTTAADMNIHIEHYTNFIK